jgi:hydrogenase maturation protease
MATDAATNAACLLESESTRPSVLVAGVGNIFLGDDAFGVEVVQRLSRCTLPEHVRVVDFGIRSYDLAYALMEPWELVILADAVSRGGEPGTVYLIEPRLPGPEEPAVECNFEAHSMNPMSVLQLVRQLDGKLCRMLVVGCEPAKVEFDDFGQFGLSDAVRTAVDEAVGLIQELIGQERKIEAA